MRPTHTSTLPSFPVPQLMVRRERSRQRLACRDHCRHRHRPMITPHASSSISSNSSGGGGPIRLRSTDALVSWSDTFASAHSVTHPAAPAHTHIGLPAGSVFFAQTGGKYNLNRPPEGRRLTAAGVQAATTPSVRREH